MMSGASTRRSGGAVALFLLAVMLASSATMNGIFSTVQEAAKADLRLTDFDLSLVQGLATAIPLALLSIPLGMLIDRWNRIRLLIGLSLLWTVGTLATAYAQSFPVLFLARMATGVSMMGAIAAAISVGADLYPPHQRGRTMLVLTIGRYAGVASAFALGGWLFGLYSGQGGLLGLTSWRSVHLALGVAALILTATLFLVREPERHEVQAGPDAPLRAVLGELWARRSFLLPLFGGQVSIVMVDMAAGIWAAPVLSRSFGLRPDQFAGWMGMVVFGAGVIGSIIGGLSADAGQRTGRRGGILIGAVIASGIAAPAAIFPMMPTVPAFGIAIFILLIGGTITGVVTATTLSVLLPNELRGLCTGLFVATAGVIALGIAPTLVTLISRMMGGDSHLGTALAIVSLVVGFLSFLSFIQAFRKAPASPI
jgi:MFS family permease